MHDLLSGSEGQAFGALVASMGLGAAGVLGHKYARQLVMKAREKAKRATAAAGTSMVLDEATSDDTDHMITQLLAKIHEARPWGNICEFIRIFKEAGENIKNRGFNTVEREFSEAFQESMPGYLEFLTSVKLGKKVIGVGRELGRQLRDYIVEDYDAVLARYHQKQIRLAVQEYLDETKTGAVMDIDRDFQIYLCKKHWEKIIADQENCMYNLACIMGRDKVSSDRNDCSRYIIRKILEMDPKLAVKMDDLQAAAFRIPPEITVDERRAMAQMASANPGTASGGGSKPSKKSSKRKPRKTNRRKSTKRKSTKRKLRKTKVRKKSRKLSRK